MLKIAALPNPDSGGGLPAGSIRNPVLGNLSYLSGVSFLQKFLSAAISLTLVIGSVIFFFMLLMGGIQWISSGGDKAALEAAKGKITNALIGIVVLFSTFVIVKIVEAFFGISILLIDINPLIIK